MRNQEFRGCQKVKKKKLTKGNQFKPTTRGKLNGLLSSPIQKFFFFFFFAAGKHLIFFKIKFFA